MDPRVTLGAVVTTRNKHGTLESFAQSLLAQSRAPDQVVVVDDASLDGTQALLGSLPASWVRIVLDRRVGQSAARNVGLRKLGTTFAICLDADIVMEREMLDAMEKPLLEDTGASFSYCGYRRSGLLRGEIRALPWDPSKLRESNFVSTMSLVRAEDLPLGPFDESLHRFEDWDLWLRMAWNGRRGVPVDRPLFTAFYARGDVSTGADMAGGARRVAMMDKARRQVSG